MILVINCGSESIKWKLFEAGKKLKIVKQGKVEILDSKEFQKILEQELGKIDKEKVSLIGHRVVHGGSRFCAPVEVTDEVVWELEKINHLAPLHNPFNVLGIKFCQRFFKNVRQVAVFDTEFFADLPEKAGVYALPEEINKEFGFRRYGFHGISHKYVSKKATGKNFDKLKIISCHLGGGASVAAIKEGKAIDTSMGFTPMEGLVMMTRSGSVDPGIILEMVKKYPVEKIEQLLNEYSGVKGICHQGEMLNVLEKIKTGDKKATLALDVYVYSIRKYIGAYFAILGGCDLLIFTGAIGVGSSKIRNMICKNLEILNKTKIKAIETDEELAIAQKIKS